MPSCGATQGCRCWGPERSGGRAAGSRPLHRLKLGAEEEAVHDRYQRCAACDELLGELEMESQGREPGEFYRDLDATDDPLHGQQEGRFLHSHHGCYCYWPLASSAASTCLRPQLLKVGVRIRITTRRAWLSYSPACPYAALCA